MLGSVERPAEGSHLTPTIVPIVPDKASREDRTQPVVSGWLNLVMQENPEDLMRLEQLLADSYERAGPHLKSIVTGDRMVGAEELVSRLVGMCLLVVATTTASGRPMTGAVDGVFYRGRFYFGTSTDSYRARHLLARPAVSATHLPKEAFQVVVHGHAEPVDVGTKRHEGFRATLMSIYVPRYGKEWEEFLDQPSVTHFRIEPEKMFACLLRDED